MSVPAFRPHPRDPDAPKVLEAFDATADEWLVSADGAYQTSAAQTMLRDGTNLQNVVIVEWPARVNHSDELRTLRFMMAPEDARGLSECLIHSADFFDQEIGS